jgi:hypothetical protein
MQKPAEPLISQPAGQPLVSTDPASIWVASFSREWGDHAFDGCIKGLPYLLCALGAASAPNATNHKLDLVAAHARLRSWWDQGLEFLVLYHRHTAILPCPHGIPAENVYVDGLWRPVALVLFRSNLWDETIRPNLLPPQRVVDAAKETSHWWYSWLPIQPVVEGLFVSHEPTSP